MVAIRSGAHQAAGVGKFELFVWMKETIRTLSVTQPLVKIGVGFI